MWFLQDLKTLLEINFYDSSSFKPSSHTSRDLYRHLCGYKFYSIQIGAWRTIAISLNRNLFHLVDIRQVIPLWLSPLPALFKPLTILLITLINLLIDQKSHIIFRAMVRNGNKKKHAWRNSKCPETVIIDTCFLCGK